VPLLTYETLFREIVIDQRIVYDTATQSATDIVSTVSLTAIGIPPESTSTEVLQPPLGRAPNPGRSDTESRTLLFRLPDGGPPATSTEFLPNRPASRPS
jgi:hypothetical protein